MKNLISKIQSPKSKFHKWILEHHRNQPLCLDCCMSLDTGSPWLLQEKTIIFNLQKSKCMIWKFRVVWRWLEHDPNKDLQLSEEKEDSSMTWMLTIPFHWQLQLMIKLQISCAKHLTAYIWWGCASSICSIWLKRTSCCPHSQCMLSQSFPPRISCLNTRGICLIKKTPIEGKNAIVANLQQEAGNGTQLIL